MKNKLISVIIGTYNSEKFIKETLESVLNQTYNNFELLVIDDGSADMTCEIVKKILHKPHRLIKKNNGGEASARNVGLQKSRGDYICFLDHDDLFLPDKLEKQVDFLNNCTEFGMVYSDYEFMLSSDNSNNWQDWDMSTGNNGSGDIFIKQFIKNKIHIITTMVRKECFDKVGLFDETIDYACDSDMWIRIAANCKIGYLPETVARYRLHDTNVSLDRETCLIHRIKSLEKNYFEYKDDFNDINLPGRIIKNLYFRLIKNYLKRLRLIKAFEYYKLYSKFIDKK